MEPADVVEHTNWWVHTPNNGRRVVHLPYAIANDDQDATDINTEPDPDPLCARYRNRSGQEWTVTSAVVIPPGYHPLCDECESALEQHLGDKANTTI